MKRDFLYIIHTYCVIAHGHPDLSGSGINNYNIVVIPITAIKVNEVGMSAIVRGRWPRCRGRIEIKPQNLQGYMCAATICDTICRAHRTGTEWAKHDSNEVVGPKSSCRIECV